MDLVVESTRKETPQDLYLQDISSRPLKEILGEGDTDEDETNPPSQVPLLDFPTWTGLEKPDHGGDATPTIGPGPLEAAAEKLHRIESANGLRQKN